MLFTGAIMDQAKSLFHRVRGGARGSVVGRRGKRPGPPSPWMVVTWMVWSTMEVAMQLVV